MHLVDMHHSTLVAVDGLDAQTEPDGVGQLGRTRDTKCISVKSIFFCNQTRSFMLPKAGFPFAIFSNAFLRPRGTYALFVHLSQKRLGKANVAKVEHQSVLPQHQTSCSDVHFRLTVATATGSHL